MTRGLFALAALAAAAIACTPPVSPGPPDATTDATVPPPTVPPPPAPQTGAPLAVCATALRLGCSLGADPECHTAIENGIAQGTIDTKVEGAAIAATTKAAFVAAAPVFFAGACTP